MPKTTIMYLSGDGTFIEDYMKSRPKDFPNTGILLSFWTLRKEGRSKQRLDKLIKETKNDKAS